MSRQHLPSSNSTMTHPGARPLPDAVRDVLYQELVGIAIELDEMPEGSYGRRLDLRERQAEIRRVLLTDAGVDTGMPSIDDEISLDIDDDPLVHLDDDALVLRDPEPRVSR